MLTISSDEIKQLVSSSQKITSLANAYADNPTPETKEAYREALAAHFDSIAGTARRSSLNYKAAYIPIQIQSDQILSKLEIAELNAELTEKHPAVRSTEKKLITVAQVEEHLKTLPSRELPNLSSEWTQVSPWDRYQADLDKATTIAEEYARGFGIPERFGRLEASRRTALASIDKYTNELKSPDYSIATRPDGTILKVYHYPVGDDLFVADPDEIETTAKVIDKIAGVVNLPKGVQYTLVSTAVGSALDSTRTLGYANRVQGGHSIVNHIRKQERVDKKTLKPFVENEAWHSTHTHAGVGSYFSHTAAHEIGHVVAFEVWPNESDMDRELAQMRRTQISIYGRESAHEFFAESFAKYVLTGKATPEFFELLRSKGLLKSQQNS